MPPPVNKSPLCLLLDQGGHSSRARVVDADGRNIAEARRAVTTRESAGGRVEQDGGEILAGLGECIRQVRDALADDAGRLTQAALAVQRGSILCWDRGSGEPLSPVLSWRDRRSLDDEVPGLSAEAIREETGLRFSPYGGAAKMAWCLDNLPPVRQALQQGRLAMGPLGSFLVHGLVAGHPHVVDHGLAQRTLLWSRHDRAWSERLLDVFGLPRGPLPALVASGADHGPLLGLPAARLRLLMGDQNAVPWCVGEPRVGDVLINMGTGAFMLRPVAAGQAPGPFQYSLLQSGREPQFALEASLHGAGSAIRWLEGRTGRTIHPDHLAAGLDRVTEPPLFRNTVDGLGSPWWQSDIEPAFISQGRVASTDELGMDNVVSGLLESLAFLIRINLDIMESLAGPADRIVLAGGLSQSDALCQRVASVLGRNVHRLRAVEATTMGLFHRLGGVRDDGPSLEQIVPDGVAGAEQRYREWLTIMPAVPRP